MSASAGAPPWPPAELLALCSDQLSGWDRAIGVGDADHIFVRASVQEVLEALDDRAAIADGTWLLFHFQAAVLVGDAPPAILAVSSLLPFTTITKRSLGDRAPR